MNGSVAGSLEWLHREKGRAWCADRRRVVESLRDLCPGRELEVSLVEVAVRGGVPEELERQAAGGVVESLVGRLAAGLEREHGLTGERSRWAVEVWAVALGVVGGGPPADLADGEAGMGDSGHRAIGFGGWGLVKCPLGGKKNDPTETFDCPGGCGRENVCLKHQDEASYRCERCMAAAVARRSAGETIRGVHGMVFAWCPPGEFMMGSPGSESGRDDDETPHRVRLTRGFWLQTTEVTQGQWEAVMGRNPSYFKGDNNRPVESVSWDEVQEFIRKLNEADPERGYRLPTEAEWEYACRAGTTGARYGKLAAIAWYKGNSGQRTHPVGQKRPNAWGLYDMLGNVNEWCADWDYDYPSGPVTDPTGPATGSDRVNRGGGWYDEARYCRAANRFDFEPGDRSHLLGFRLAKSFL